MNRTEARYARVLDGRQLAGEIRAWAFERDTLALGPEMTFTPDFAVEHLNGSTSYIDVKGMYTWEDATVKIKAASVMYPGFAFYQVRYRRGRWVARRFRSR